MKSGLPGIIAQYNLKAEKNFPTLKPGNSPLSKYRERTKCF